MPLEGRRPVVPAAQRRAFASSRHKRNRPGRLTARRTRKLDYVCSSLPHRKHKRLKGMERHHAIRGVDKRRAVIAHKPLGPLKPACGA